MSFATADLYDAFGDALQVFEGQLLDFGGRPRFFGPIRTLKVFEDNTLVREALSEPSPGSILVVDGAGSRARALVGDALGQLALSHGWAGIVVNGCIRDSVELGKMALGLKALGTTPRKTQKKGQGLRDEVVRFGGVVFSPGHWLYADEDGLVVSDTELALP